MLRMLSLFSELTPSELEQLAKIITEVKVQRGEIIFSQGDMTRDFFIIKHGQVEISVKDSYQEKRVISILKNGEFFGEMSLFDKNAPRSATAQAFQNTALYKIPGRAFETLLEDQPSICFKLLGTMSKRLREIINPEQAASLTEQVKNGKVITIASARSGYGKTTLATTMASIFSHELPRRVLFLDLDLSNGDGTFLMGVYTPTSILDLAFSFTGEAPTEEHLGKFMARLSPNLSLLAAPKEIVDGEKLNGEDLIKVISVCRRFFDYIVIDTNCTISEVFLNALDMSDQIFFLIDCRDSIAIKSNSAFFRAISHLNLSESHVGMILSHRSKGTLVESVQKLFKWKIAGELPEIPNLKLETGELPYQTMPSGEFCNAVRLLIKSVFQEETLQITSEAGFLRRWFLPPSQTKAASEDVPEEMPSESSLVIQEEYCSTLLKDIRGEITKGFLDDALKDCLHLINLIPHSAFILEMLGEVFYLKRDFANSLDVFSKALKQDPENYLALGYIAVIKNSDEMRKKALGILSEKIKKSPSYPDLQNDMGRLLYSFNQLTEATSHFEKALALNPSYHEARINMALVLGEEHKYEEALRQLFQVKPKSIRVYYLIGNYLYSTGKFYEAIAAYNRVSEINPGYLDINAKLASLSDYFSKLNNLLELHKKLSRNSPTYPDLHYKMGNLHLLVGNREAAMEEFRWTNELKPGYRDVKNKLADLNHDQEFEVNKFLDEEALPAQASVTSADIWTIVVENLKDLFADDSDHMFVLRLYNPGNQKKHQFALYPPQSGDPCNEFEVDSDLHLQDADTLNIELFDHTGVLFSQEHPIVATEKARRCIRFAITLPTAEENPAPGAENISTSPREEKEEGTS